MSKLKKCLALSLIIILMIGVSGCMNGQFFIPGSNEAKMHKHLRKKYNGQEFITIGMSNS